MSETVAAEGRYKTPALRCSYPKLFEPEVNDHGEEVWGSVLLIEDTPDGRACLKKLEELADEAGKAKFGAKYPSLRKSPGFKYAVRYDVEKYESLEPKVIAFINARSYKTAPGIVSIYPGPDGKPAKITDPKLIYPGCYLKASVYAYATDHQPKGGGGRSQSVSIGLGNVQKVRDGDRIDARVNAEDEFVADPDAAADLDDL